MTQDAKLYSRQTVEHDLKTYAMYGVTTVQSLGLDSDLIFPFRDEQRASRPTMTRVYTAGQGFAYDGGIGGAISFPGVPGAVFKTVSDVEPAVAEQARKHVDIIKFWTDDNFGKAKRMPYDICKAIIDSAHRHGLRAVAHVFYLEDAKGLLRAGIDAFAHGIRDMDIDAEGLALFKAHRNVIVVPNLPDRGVVADFSWLSDSLPAAEVRKLQEAATDRPAVQATFGIQARNLAKLNAAGGLDPRVASPEEFNAMIRRDYEKYDKVVKELNLKLD
jgi:imidazolonepropionase-like amidohydrolase